MRSENDKQRDRKIQSRHYQGHSKQTPECDEGGTMTDPWKRNQ
jgi:hypothetical protein